VLCERVAATGEARRKPRERPGRRPDDRGANFHWPARESVRNRERAEKHAIIIRTFLALSVTTAPLTAVSLPARAGDGGAVAAGILGGTALGFLAGTAIAHPPPPVYYAPAYAPPPPRCWWEPQEVWNGYAYIIQQVHVCN